MSPDEKLLRRSAGEMVIDPEWCEACQEEYENYEAHMDSEGHIQAVCEHSFLSQTKLDGQILCEDCGLVYGGPDGDGPDD